MALKEKCVTNTDWVRGLCLKCMVGGLCNRLKFCLLYNASNAMLVLAMNLIFLSVRFLLLIRGQVEVKSVLSFVRMILSHEHVSRCFQISSFTLYHIFGFWYHPFGCVIGSFLEWGESCSSSYLWNQVLMFAI